MSKSLYSAEDFFRECERNPARQKFVDRANALHEERCGWEEAFVDQGIAADKLKAENARLREALDKLCNTAEIDFPNSVAEARAALEIKKAPE